MQEEVALLTRELHKAQQNNNSHDEVKIYQALIEYHYRRDDFLKAKRLCFQLLDKYKRTKGVHKTLALIALQDRNVDIAIKELKKELELDKTDLEIQRLLRKLETYSTFPYATTTLLIVNLAVFLYTLPSPGITSLLQLAVNSNSYNIFSLITSLFTHANFLHFILNMVALSSFGFYLEKFIGSFRFIAIFFLSGIVGNLMQVLSLFDFGFVLGTSAGIFGILGAILMREPLLSMRFLGIFKVPLILILGFVILFSMLISTFSLNLPISFGEVAHMTGLYIGIFLAAAFYHETISTFYYWVFISFGFLILGFAIKSIMLGIVDYLTLFFQVFLGSLMIVYSYSLMKLKFSVGVEDE